MPSLCRFALLCLAASGIGLAALPRAAGQSLAERMGDLNVRVTTEHYVLAGTVSDKTLNDYGQLLEFIYREYAKGFAEVLASEESAAPARNAAPPPRRSGGRKGGTGGADGTAQTAPPTSAPAGQPLDPAEKRFPVLVFATEHDYHAFGREFLQGGTENTGGLFIPSLGVLLILDRGNPDDTARVLFHEAFHQFVHRYIRNPPMWLNEGLATYYGDARPTRKGLSFDRPQADYWKIARKVIEKDQALPLWDVVRASRAEFYNPTPVKIRGFENTQLRTLYYAQAYTLIHTLLADSSGRERLRDYVRALAQDGGRNTEKITREYFGPDACEHMTAFWREHVNRRPENG